MIKISQGLKYFIENPNYFNKLRINAKESANKEFNINKHSKEADVFLFNICSSARIEK